MIKICVAPLSHFGQGRKKRQSSHTLARQKSRPKPKKREQRVCTLLTPPPPTTSSTMPRTPLGPISANRTPKKELTLSERAIVYRASRSGEKTASIASRENLKKSTIRGIIKRYPTQPQGISKPRSGRPLKLSERNKRFIIHVAKGEPAIEYGELISRYAEGCSKSTVYRALKEYGLVNWLAQKRLLLSEAIVRKRLAWCKAREHWTEKQ